MSRQNYSVARVETRTRESITQYERHNERKNEHYGNMNVDLSCTPMNVHFKSCGDMTYNETLDKLVADGKVSLRGLKKDAKIFDEMILDVNTDYFEAHGGYEYAKRFYEEAYRFAVKLYGEDNILSAVMHADEVNLALSDWYDEPIYHYHMHIVALPVVEKQVLWTKRCKNSELVGTVKEVVQQISHSKKWKSPQAVDKQGKPVYDAKGKAVLVPTYSILQDEFFEHMQAAGFTDFERGERGSTAENKTSLQYQIDRDKERLYRMFGTDSTDNLFFSVSANQLGNGLDEQLAGFMCEHPDTSLIIIDTLQKVREVGGNNYSYANDYQIITRLKKLADSYGICLLLVHHTRKQNADDKFDMISGTNGLLGAADGAFLLAKEKRTSNAAALEISGRDQQDQRLHLIRNENSLAWELERTETELWKAPLEPLLEKIAQMLSSGSNEWTGTPTQLCSLLGIDVQSNSLTRKLNVNATRLLNEYGISYESSRNRNERKVKLTLIKRA